MLLLLLLAKGPPYRLLLSLVVCRGSLSPAFSECSVGMGTSMLGPLRPAAVLLELLLFAGMTGVMVRLAGLSGAACLGAACLGVTSTLIEAEGVDSSRGIAEEDPRL